MGLHETEFLLRERAARLAYRHSAGTGPAVVWCGGLRSDMSGTKAAALHEWAEGSGRAYLRFDYAGHGESDGAFAECTLSTWLADTLAVIDAMRADRMLLVGSSMGGWLALLAALARPGKIAGLMLIAPAPDFTERSLWQDMSFAERRALADRGRIEKPSAYSPEPTVITRALIEDGRRHLILDAPIPFPGPVRILHGQSDPDVPWRQSLLLAEQIQSADVTTTFVKDGDHRLSRPQDIALLIRATAELAGAAGLGAS